MAIDRGLEIPTSSPDSTVNEKSRQPMKELDELYRGLGYTFRQTALIEEAFRHSSYVNECGNPGLTDNERLEFLGDAVLDLAVSHILMEMFEDAREGDLSKYRAGVVNERGLCRIAGQLDLGKYILLGKGEEHTGGREKPSILANTLEALLGALYLETGFEKAKEIIHRLFLPLLIKIDSGRITGDFKSLLQEYTQEKYKTRPEYQVVSEVGPAHDKTFEVVIGLNGQIIARGQGKSKKEAEQRAAKEAFLCLTETR